MELRNSSMSNRQRAFRATYRQQIATWYNGWLHVSVIFIAGFSIIYVCSANLSDVAWWQWGVIPAVFLTYQFGEYWAHRVWLHRPARNGALRELYNRHTLQHHQFFTDDEMRFADHMDWRVTFFPPFTMATMLLIALPSAVIVGLLIYSRPRGRPGAFARGRMRRHLHRRNPNRETLPSTCNTRPATRRTWENH